MPYLLHLGVSLQQLVSQSPDISEYMGVEAEEGQSCPYPSTRIYLFQPYWIFFVFLCCCFSTYFSTMCPGCASVQETTCVGLMCACLPEDVSFSPDMGRLCSSYGVPCDTITWVPVNTPWPQSNVKTQNYVPPGYRMTLRFFCKPRMSTLWVLRLS